MSSIVSGIGAFVKSKKLPYKLVLISLTFLELTKYIKQLKDKYIFYWDFSDALIIRVEGRCKAVGRSYSNIVPLLYQNTFHLLKRILCKNKFSPSLCF